MPGYSLDFNADEAIWGWVRADATGNLCLGSKAGVQERVGKFSGRVGQPEMESDGAAGRSCSQGPERSGEARGPIPGSWQMHIPPWPKVSRPMPRRSLIYNPRQMILKCCNLITLQYYNIPMLSAGRLGSVPHSLC